MISGNKFDKIFFSSGAYNNYDTLLNKWVEPVGKRIYRLLKDKSSVRVLDVGCGFGDLLVELQNKYNFSVEGLEYSFYAVKKARKSVRGKIKEGSILKMPFKKNSFDVVVCFDVIYYCNSQETTQAIKNLIDVSRDYIFFNSIYKHSEQASQKNNPDPLRLVVLSKKEYIKLFSQNGAKFVGKFYSENGGQTLVFKKTKA